MKIFPTNPSPATASVFTAAARLLPCGPRLGKPTDKQPKMPITNYHVKFVFLVYEPQL
jgi:hypothetical protein